MATVNTDGMSFTDLDQQGVLATMGGDAMQNQMMGWAQPGMQHFVQDMDLGANPVNPDNNAAQGGDNNVNVQNILSSLANGGGNNSIQLDSGSLLQFLQDDPENPGLMQFLQSAEPDMQS